jgi:1-aminocyclopropane-1-carboxylate deaminase/D-cysteine desulfhydrase-like pyridoxal-dependent ACC family enzyme
MFARSRWFGVCGRAPATRSLLVNDLEVILAVRHCELGRWPTPVGEIETPFGAVLVKRDDLSGFGRGGAKTRKIESLIAYLLTHGHDELVTVAGNITNLAFDLLPALRQADVRSSLFILDEPPIDSRLRERLFGEILGELHLLGRSRATATAAAVGAYLRARKTGRQPLLLLPGATHPVAVAGNARGFIEMVAQLEESGTRLPETVFVTAASGTTVAGFLVAEHALRRTGRRPIQIVGVQVYPGPLKTQAIGLIRWTERFLRLSDRVPRERIVLDSSQLHHGFGAYPDSLAAACKHLRSESGIALDPIFGGKTWAAMEASRRRRRPGSVLYWHCGYTPEWQALQPRRRVVADLV